MKSHSPVWFGSRCVFPIVSSLLVLISCVAEAQVTPVVPSRGSQSVDPAPGSESWAKGILRQARSEESQNHLQKARELYESVLSSSGKEGWIPREVRFRIEDSFRRQQDVPGLAAWYEAWLQKNGKDADAALLLSDALSELHRKQDAISWLRKAAEWAPERNDVAEALARRLEETGHADEAIDIWRKLSDSGIPRSREALGEAYWKVFQATKTTAASRSAFETWQRLAPPDEKDVERLYHAAGIFGAHGFPNEALRLYERAASLSPDAREPRSRWAEYLFELKRDEDAWKVLHGLVEGARATAPNFLHLAGLQEQHNDIAGALSSVRQGLKIEPGNFGLLSREWRLLALSGQWKAATGLFQRLLTAAPDLASSESVEEGLVEALRRLGTLEEITKSLSARAEEDPKSSGRDSRVSISDGDVTQAVSSTDSKLSERDFRVLLCIALQNGSLTMARNSLDAAQRQFPASVPLAHRRVELERRMGQPEIAVAELRRLGELDAAREQEWLREIVQTFEKAGLWDDAIAAARSVIENAPNDPDSHVLAATVDFADGHLDDGLADLSKAISLADQTNGQHVDGLRLWQGRVLLESGRFDAAVAAFEKSFDPNFVRDDFPNFIPQLAEAYARQGRLPELIEHYRKRQRTENDGWRCALSLSEIFRQERNFVAAREELANAFGPCSRDPGFLSQEMRISADEVDSVERERLARLLAAAVPGADHERELASAMLDNGDTDEAVKVLQANENAVMNDPMKWREVEQQFVAAGEGKEFARILEAGLSHHADDWHIRLVLAETVCGTGDLDHAESLLREIESMPPELAVASSRGNSTDPDHRPFRGGPMFGGVAYAFWTHGMMGSDYGKRVFRGYFARRNFARITASLGGISSLRTARMSAPDFVNHESVNPHPQSLNEARDTALIELSIIARQRGHSAEFLAALADRLKDTPLSERIAAYTLVQAIDPLMEAISGEAAHPSEDAISRDDCLEALMNLALQGAFPSARVKVDQARLADLIQALLPRVKNPETALSAKCVLHAVLLRVGREKEAGELAAEVLAGADSVPLAHARELFDFAMESHSTEVAGKILSRLAAQGGKAVSGGDPDSLNLDRSQLARALLGKKESAGFVKELLSDALGETYRPYFPGLISMGQIETRPERHASLQFPYANRFIGDYRFQSWSDIFELVKSAGLLEEFKGVLDKQIATLPGDQAVQARLARVCFQWWTHQREDATREAGRLADQLRNEDIRLMQASMLAEMERPAEALKALDQIPATQGLVWIDKLIRTLDLALGAKDNESAKKIALELADQRLSPNDQGDLSTTLNALGLSEKAAELNARMASTLVFMGGRGRFLNWLQREDRPGHRDEAITAAKALLAMPPSPDQPDAWQSAIEVLRRFKVLPDFIADLEAQLAEDSSSPRTLELLAAAYEHKDPKKALEYCRKLVELKPDRLAFQIRLAKLFQADKLHEEAMRVWETVFDREPDFFFRGNIFPILQTYQSAKQTDRLAEVLVRKPLRRNPLLDLARTPFDDSVGYDQVAEALRKEGEIDQAIQVWRVALGHDRSGGELAYRPEMLVKPLVSALIEAGRKDEAADELEQYFFPRPKSKPLLGFESGFTFQNWDEAFFQGNGRVELRGYPLLLLARRAGALDRIRTKAAELAETRPRGIESCLVLIIDALRHDTGKVEEIGKAIDNAFGSVGERPDFRTARLYDFLGQLLREWPEEQRLALRLLEKSPQSAESYDGKQFLQLANLAVELGETGTARSALQKWRDMEEKRARFADFSPAESQISTVNLLARAGMGAEAADLLRKLQSNPAWKGNDDAQRGLERSSDLLALLAGDPRKARVTVWAVPREKDVPHTKIAWEIGPSEMALIEKPNEPFPKITGENLTKLDGRFTLEIYYGSSPKARQMIASIPAAKMRGAWESPEPLGQGYLSAILRKDDIVVLSQDATIPGGPNLIENSRFKAASGDSADAPQSGVPGWPGLVRTDFTLHRGGPVFDGESILVELPSDSSPHGLAAQRIPLESGKSYDLTAWIHCPSPPGRVSLGGRFLDQNGNPLGTIPFNSIFDTTRWIQYSVRLVGMRKARLGERSTAIPEKAAFFEPLIEPGETIFEMSDLYFGEVFPESSR